MDSPDKSILDSARILGIDPSDKPLDPVTIKAAFRVKAKAAHVDRKKVLLGREPTPDEAKFAHERMKEINGAYEKLKKYSGEIEEAKPSHTSNSSSSRNEGPKTDGRSAGKIMDDFIKEALRKSAAEVKPLNCRRFSEMVLIFGIKYPNKPLSQIEELNMASLYSINEMADNARLEGSSIYRNKALDKERDEFFGMVRVRRSLSRALNTAMAYAQDGAPPYDNGNAEINIKVIEEWKEYIRKYPVGKYFEGKMSAFFSKYYTSSPN